MLGRKSLGTDCKDGGRWWWGARTALREARGAHTEKGSSLHPRWAEAKPAKGPDCHRETQMDVSAERLARQKKDSVNEFLS